MSSYRQQSIDRDSLFGDDQSETYNDTAGPLTDPPQQSVDGGAEAQHDTIEEQQIGSAADTQQHVDQAAKPTPLPDNHDPFNTDVSMFGESNTTQMHDNNEHWLSQNNLMSATNDYGLPELESNDLFDNQQDQLQMPDDLLNISGAFGVPDFGQNTNMEGTNNQQTQTAISSQDNAGPSQTGFITLFNSHRPRLLTDDELHQLEDLLPRMTMTWEKCLDRCRQADFSPMAVRIRDARYQEHKTTMRQLYDELSEAIRNRLGIPNPCSPADNARATHFFDGIFTKARKAFERASAGHIDFRAPVECWPLDQFNYLINIQWAAEGVIRGPPPQHDLHNAFGVTQLTTMNWQQEITRKWIERLRRDTPRDTRNDDDHDGGDDHDDDDDNDDNDDNSGDKGNGGDQPRLNRFRKPAPPAYDSSEAEESGPKGRPGRPPGAKNKTSAERAAAKAAKTSRRRRRAATKPAMKPPTQPTATAAAAAAAVAAALSSSAPAGLQPSQTEPQRMNFNPIAGFDLPVNGPWREHHQPPRGIPQSAGTVQPEWPPIGAPVRTPFDHHMQQQRQRAATQDRITQDQSLQAATQLSREPPQALGPPTTPQRVVSTPTRLIGNMITSTPQDKPSPRVKTPPSGKVERTYFR